MMKVYIVFSLGLGDDEDQWEVCDVKLSEAGAREQVESLTEETGCEYKYEEYEAT